MGVSGRWSVAIRPGNVSGIENGEGCLGKFSGTGGSLLIYKSSDIFSHDHFEVTFLGL